MEIEDMITDAVRAKHSPDLPPLRKIPAWLYLICVIPLGIWCFNGGGSSDKTSTVVQASTVEVPIPASMVKASTVEVPIPASILGIWCLSGTNEKHNSYTRSNQLNDKCIQITPTEYHGPKGDNGSTVRFTRIEQIQHGVKVSMHLSSSIPDDNGHMKPWEEDATSFWQIIDPGVLFMGEEVASEDKKMRDIEDDEFKLTLVKVGITDFSIVTRIDRSFFQHSIDVTIGSSDPRAADYIAHKSCSSVKDMHDATWRVRVFFPNGSEASECYIG